VPETPQGDVVWVPQLEAESAVIVSALCASLPPDSVATESTLVSCAAASLAGESSIESPGLASVGDAESVAEESCATESELVSKVSDSAAWVSCVVVDVESGLLDEPLDPHADVIAMKPKNAIGNARMDSPYSQKRRGARMQWNSRRAMTDRYDHTIDLCA
jgi:hypothetical protein